MESPLQRTLSTFILIFTFLLSYGSFQLTREANKESAKANLITQTQFNKQFAYQRERDSIKDIEQNKQDEERIQKEEELAAKSNRQFEKNIQLMSKQIATLKSMSDYVVNSQRPYLELHSNSTVTISDTNTQSIVFSFCEENRGMRAAVNIATKYFLIELDSTLMKGSDEFSANSPNSLSNGNAQCFSQIMNIKTLTGDVTPIYCVIFWEYQDAITKMNYSQVVFLMWKGIRQGAISNQFGHCTTWKSKLLLKYLAKNYPKIYPKILKSTL